MSLSVASRLWPENLENEPPPEARAEARVHIASPGTLESFVDRCEQLSSPSEVEHLFLAVAKQTGMDKVALTTHARPHELGSFEVCAHNWSAPALAHLQGNTKFGVNPLFERTELTGDPVYWNDPVFRRGLDAEQSAWMERMFALGLRDGVSQQIRTAIAPASVSMTTAWGRNDPVAVRRVVWMAGYALNTIVALRMQQASAPDLLSRRERQCLSLAVFSGLRPREVAKQLGVSIHTVRTVRKNTNARLGARSTEEAVWRFVESGQLFCRGRASPLRRGKS